MHPSSFLFRHRYTFMIAVFFLSIVSILLWNLNITFIATNVIFEKFNLDSFQNSQSQFEIQKVSQNSTEKSILPSVIVMNVSIIPIDKLRRLLAQNHPHLSVDKRKLSREELVNQVASSIRSLPRPPFLTEQWAITAINVSCAESPSILDVQFVNTYWQVVNKSVGTLYLYGAYYDNRPLTIKALNGPVIRILGMMDQYLDPSQADEDYCQLRFENELQPIITKIIERQYIGYNVYQNGDNTTTYHPYLFACQIPPTDQGKVPYSVSVVKNPCDFALNNLGVQYTKPRERKPFAVCVKGLHVPQEEDLSIRLVEWVELMRLLGADKIFLYDYHVHPNISKVMKYYQSTGFVDVTPITLPGYLPTNPKLVHLYLTDPHKFPGNWMQELIPLNDCLYRNLHSYEYLAVIDADEVIMPMRNITTWSELLKVIKKEHPKEFNESSAILFRNSYFFDTFMNNRSRFPEISWYMHPLQQVYRASNYSREDAKCLYKVDRVIAVNNHCPRHCFDTSCKPLEVNADEEGRLQHYKPECPPYVENCNAIFMINPVLDTTIWKYKDKLVESTEEVLKKSGFISDLSKANYAPS